MTISKRLFPTTLALTLASFPTIACSVATGDAPTDPTATEATAIPPGAPRAALPTAVNPAKDLPTDPTLRFDPSGLRLDENTFDRVAGTFTHYGTTIRFAFGHDGAKQTMSIKTEAGAPLVDSTFENGVDSAEYFGGAARASGAVDVEPTKEGDSATFERVATMPEMRALPFLKEALLASHVDRGPFTPGGIEKDVTFGSGPYIFLTSYGDTYQFWSWSFWGTTTVLLANAGNTQPYLWPSGQIDWSAYYSGYTSGRVQAGGNAPESVAGYGPQQIARQWWGALVTVTDTEGITLGGCSYVPVLTGWQCTASWAGQTCTPVYTWYFTCAPSVNNTLVLQHW